MTCAMTALPRLICVILAILLVVTYPAAAQTQPTLKGNYVLAEEGTTMSGPFASLALLSFSETGAITGTQVLRSATGIETKQFQGSLVLASPTMGTLHLRYEVGDEENPETQEIAYTVAMTQTSIRAIRTTFGGHSVATLLPTVTNRNGTYLSAEAGLQGKVLCRIMMVTLDPSGAASATSISAHPVHESATLLGRHASSENGFPTFSLAAEAEEEGDGNVATENYVAAFHKDGLIALRKEGGIVRLCYMTR